MSIIIEDHLQISCLFLSQIVKTILYAAYEHK